MATLRELLLAIKIKVDKAAIGQTDVAFDHAAKSAQTFETRANAAVSPLKKVATQLRLNTQLAEKYARALLPAGALPSRPESPSDRNARRMSELTGLSAKRSHPEPPRPGGHPMAAPDIRHFLDTGSTDVRTGPQKALDAFKAKASAAMASAGDAVTRMNARFDELTSKVFNARNALTGLGIVIAATAIGRFIGDVINAGGALHDMAQRTRVSVETLQVWRAIATDAGVDAGAIEGAFRKLNKSMAAAARGGKLQAAAFKDLGVQLKDGDRLRPIEEVLIDTGAALAAMDDDAKATAIAVQLLGPAGAGLVPAFNNGAEAVRRLSAEMKENVALNAEEAARLDEVGDALTRGTKKWTALKTRAIVAILPLLEKAASVFESVSKWILRMGKETKILQTLFAAFAAGGLFRLVTMLGAWVVRVGGARAALAIFAGGLRTAAGFAFRFLMPLLLIEDFLTFLAGGKSVFGRAFEEIFGPGGAKSVREGILAALTEVGAFINTTLLPAIRGIVDNELFKGGAKLALDGILSVLNLIGFALADTDAKAAALAETFRKNAESLGLAPSKEQVAASVTQGLPENRKPMTEGEGLARRAMVAVFGDPLKDNPAVKANQAANEAKLAQLRGKPGDFVGPPVAPTGPAARGPITINDQRKIDISVGDSSKPGAVGRAVGAAADGALTKDRRQTLNAVSG